MNLMKNAIKFSHLEGDPIVITGKILGALDQRFLEVSVSDKGIGILEKEKKQVFTQFWSSSDERSKLLNVKARGLGLSISK